MLPLLFRIEEFRQTSLSLADQGVGFAEGMTETDPEKRLIGYACISPYGQMLDTQLSRAHLRRRRRSGIGRLTDPTAAAQLWLRAGSSCPRLCENSSKRRGDAILCLITR